MPVNQTIEAAFGDLQVVEQTEVPGVVIQAKSHYTVTTQDEPERFHPTVSVFLDEGTLVQFIDLLEDVLAGVYDTKARQADLAREMGAGL